MIDPALEKLRGGALAEIPAAVAELGVAVGRVYDRLDMLMERLTPVRSARPRPVSPGGESGAPEGAVPLAVEIREQAGRVQRLEQRIGDLLDEIAL